MTSKIQNVIVIGAGGSIGPSILKALEPHFSVSVLSRKSSKSTFPSKFQIITVDDDYPFQDIHQAFLGQDAVVCCISPWATNLQYRIIDAATKAGVKRFIPAEFGGDSTNSRAIAMIPPFQSRVDVVAHLKTKESLGLTWTAIINGAIFDWGMENGFLGFDLAKREAEIFDDGEQTFSVSTRALIGEAVAKILLRPDDTVNKYLFVSSFTTTQNEILETLKYTHGLPWTTRKVKSKEKIEEAEKEIQSGGNAKDAFRNLLLVTVYSAGYGNDFRGKEANRILDLPVESLEEVVKSLEPGKCY